MGESLCECRSNDSYLVVSPAGGAVEEKSPCALHVLHGGNELQQCTMIVQDANEMTCHKVCVTQRCSEHLNALLIGGQT